MNKIILGLLIGLFISPSSFGQCEEYSSDKVLLIGDSWAFFMHLDGTFDEVQKKWGHSNHSYFSSADLAVNGARTNDFLTESKLNAIENALMDNPQFKVVHLSLGGNDVLGEWNVDYTPFQTDSLQIAIYDRLVSIIDFIHDIRPEIEIVWSGYMYPNFEEVINEFAPFESSHPFYGSWEDMGFPNFEQLNTILTEFSNGFDALMGLEPLVSFIPAQSLMQQYYGQEIPLEVAPFGSYSPGFQPLPVGDVTYPSPKVSMRDYGVTRDCFHLSEEGYFIMMDYQFQKIYHKLLMDDVYLFPLSDNKSGTVFTDSTNSSLFKVGGDDGTKSLCLLSFDPASIADTIIESASIFLRRTNLVGDKPFTGTVNLRFVNGSFGTEEVLDIDDMEDEGLISEELCVFGKNDEDGDWVRIDFSPEITSLISKDESFQIIIESLESDEGDEIEFSNLDNPEFAPVLNLKYKTEDDDLSISENKDLKIYDAIQLFPNPTKSVLYFNLNQEGQKKITVINLAGQVVYKASTNLNSIDVSAIPQGSYFLKIEAERGVFIEQFIKQ